MNQPKEHDTRCTHEVTVTQERVVEIFTKGAWVKLVSQPVVIETIGTALDPNAAKTLCDHLVNEGDRFAEHSNFAWLTEEDDDDGRCSSVIESKECAEQGLELAKMCVGCQTYWRTAAELNHKTPEDYLREVRP